MQLHFILSNFSSLVKSQAEQSKAEGRDVSSKQGNCYLPILVVGGHVSLEEAFFLLLSWIHLLHSQLSRRRWRQRRGGGWCWVLSCTLLWYETTGKNPLLRSILIYFFNVPALSQFPFVGKMIKCCYLANPCYLGIGMIIEKLFHPIEYSISV